MAKELAILAVSMITLLVAGYAAYSVMELSDTPSPRQVSAEKDYTGELKSIQASLNDVHKKLEALESDMAELQTIKDALDEIDHQTQPVVQKPTQSTPTLDITTDKTSYTVGESIIITANGVLPQGAVKLDLYSSLDELIATQIVYSDSAGKLVYEMKLPSFIKTGNYKLKALYNNIVDEIIVSVSGSTQSTTETSSDDTTSTQSDPIVTTTSGLSFSLDKGSYKPDEIVWVSGKGAPNSAVVLKMTSPDGKIQMANTSTLSDGSFKPVFVLPSDAKAGDWVIVATQGDKEAKVTLKVYTQ
ncbi:MAG: hypothetical protein FJ356_03420 [Thaumarchaeota archaeon]|nr:hypothetical protein [Nitrososphaerota archaeon]